MYIIVRDDKHFRVLNTKTRSLNKAILNTYEIAQRKVAELVKWADYNHSPAGKDRTARGNAKRRLAKSSIEQ